MDKFNPFTDLSPVDKDRAIEQLGGATENNLQQLQFRLRFTTEYTKQFLNILRDKNKSFKRDIDRIKVLDERLKRTIPIIPGLTGIAGNIFGEESGPFAGFPGFPIAGLPGRIPTRPRTPTPQPSEVQQEQQKPSNEEFTRQLSDILERLYPGSRERAGKEDTPAVIPRTPQPKEKELEQGEPIPEPKPVFDPPIPSLPPIRVPIPRFDPLSSPAALEPYIRAGIENSKKIKPKIQYLILPDGSEISFVNGRVYQTLTAKSAQKEREKVERINRQLALLGLTNLPAEFGALGRTSILAARARRQAQQAQTPLVGENKTPPRGSRLQVGRSGISRQDIQRILNRMGKGEGVKPGTIAEFMGLSDPKRGKQFKDYMVGMRRTKKGEKNFEFSERILRQLGLVEGTRPPRQIDDKAFNFIMNFHKKYRIDPSNLLQKLIDKQLLDNSILGEPKNLNLIRRAREAAGVSGDIPQRTPPQILAPTPESGVDPKKINIEQESLKAPAIGGPQSLLKRNTGVKYIVFVPKFYA